MNSASDNSDNHSPASLHCMQLRCGERHLLMPRSAVIELRAYTPPEPLATPPNARASWLLGTVKHLDHAIPLLALDKLIDTDSPVSRETQICILQALEPDLNPPCYAVVCQGFPALVEVPANLSSEQSQQHAAENPDANNPLIAAQLLLNGYYHAIPNLPLIETQISRTLTSDPAS